MRQTWKDYEKAAEKSPLSLLVKIGLTIVVLSVLFGSISYGLSWFSETAQIAKEEFGPRAMLKKYEYFKDVAAQLDKKRGDVGIYQSRISSMVQDYEGSKRKDWDRTDKEQMSTWQSEVSGVKASYNALAADYNSQMSKFNWAFTNVGSLPKGAIDTLPREFKEYLSN